MTTMDAPKGRVGREAPTAGADHPEEVGRAQNKATVRILKVLSAFAGDRSSYGVTELSRRLGMTKNMVHRALITLEEADCITCHQGSTRYQTGLMSAILLRALPSAVSVRRAGLPTLYTLAAETRLTASLWVRVGWYVLLVAAVDGDSDVHRARRPGESTLLNKGAAALAMLATLDDGEIRRFFAFARSKAHTALLDAEPVADRRRLARWREAGLVTLPDRAHHGWASTAVPFRDRAGRPVAALAVEGLVGGGDATGFDDGALATLRTLAAALAGTLARAP